MIENPSKDDTPRIPQGPLAGTVRTHSEVEETDGGVAKERAEQGSDGEPPSKRIKLSGAQKKKLARERNLEKKKEKGQNKGRRFQRVHDEQEICWRMACGLRCDLGDK